MRSERSLALSDAEIKDGLKAGSIRIRPFRQESLNPAGYDLRSGSKITIEPGAHALVATRERLTLGLDLVGMLQIRSSMAREGLVASLALVDPGFDGQLTISVTNLGSHTISIHKGEPFVQLVLLRLGQGARRGYGGRYQGSTGVVESRR